MSTAGTASQKRARRPALLAVPLLLIAAIVAFFVALGPAGIFPGDFPPVEELSIGRVTLSPGEIQLVVTNGGPSPVTVAQVLMQEAYWSFSSDVQGPIDRLNSATLTIPFPWVEGEPVDIALVTSTGLTFEHTIEVATTTPEVDARFLLMFGLIGIYIGLIPVLAGMTFKPFLATLPVRWVNFFLALTAGVLLFLALDTAVDALEEAAVLPSAFGGVGLVVLGAVGAFVLTYLAAHSLGKRKGTDSKLVLAFVIAAGIGVHNLGEGLAVGAAYRLGEIALGTFLIIGFALHNTTEGLGIVSVLSDKKTPFSLLVGLGAIAGLPTVVGAWAGAFFFSPLLATIFLAVATGAIAQVVLEVMGIVRKSSKDGLTSPEALAGLTAGLAVMYITGLFVAA
ncbi:MAG: ZIP family metal transporter [Actinomycetota bacterium]